MKSARFEISNFRSVKDLRIKVKAKSKIFKTLQFLFDKNISARIAVLALDSTK